MKNGKLIILLLIIVLAGGSLFAQRYAGDSKIVSKNHILISFLADASMINIKYERVLKSTNFGFASAAVGAGLGMSGNSESIYTSESFQEKELFGSLPHHLTFNFGKNRNFLETGIGGSLLMGGPNQDYVGYPMLGYRFQNAGSIKSNFRIYLQLLIAGNPGPDVLFIPLGFSIGTSL